MNVWIAPINTNTLRLSWNSTPGFVWQDYQIDGFNVSITNINSSLRVLETMTGLQDSLEIGRCNLTDADILWPCTLFNFSVSSISATYGESDPSFVIGGFNEGRY